MVKTDPYVAQLINELAKPIMLWRWNRALGEATHRTSAQKEASQKIVTKAEEEIDNLIHRYMGVK